MKYLIKILGTILFFLLFFLIHSCKKDKPTSPIVTTISVNGIFYTTAISGGNVTNEGGDPVVSRGVCWSTNDNPTIANNKTTESGGLGIFTSNISQLIPNTFYYLRAYATNIVGTGYGNQVSFTTNQVSVPILTTSEINTINNTNAISGGNITDDKGEFVIARGVCWNTETDPTIENYKTIDGTGIGSFVSNLTRLQPGTTYFVRAYATNNVGTGYGNNMSFTTTGIIFNPNLTYGTLSDIDGNVYKTINIGAQIWMAENLKTSKYKDGIAIPIVSDNTAWIGLTTPGYCWYNNNEAAYKDIYGALYNWYAANSGKLCPTDWHVPSETDWITLNDYLGSGYIAGGKLKETGTTHWYSPNSGATNEVGFTALPGGYRVDIGSFNFIHSSGNWWSSTEYSGVEAYRWFMNDDNSNLLSLLLYCQNGLSVRCIKD